MADESEQSTQRRKYVEQHLGLVLTGLVFAFFVLKLAVEARGDYTTARAIAAESSPAAVALGIATILLPALLVGYLWTTPSTIYRKYRRWPTAVGMASLAFVFAMYIPAFLAALAAILGGRSLYKDIRAQTKGTLDDDIQSGKRRITWVDDEAALFGVLAALLILFLSPMWLPTQRLTPSTGEPFTAYVLNEGDTTTVVLRAKDAEVLQIPNEDVESLKLCGEGPSFWSVTVASLLSPRPDARYPDCPSD